PAPGNQRCHMLFIIRPILVAGVLAVSGTAAPAQTRPDRPETPEVRTAATVQRSVQPDLATVTLQFTGEGATPAQGGSRPASRVGAVLDTALGRGITDISEVRFTATDVSAPQVEALREATVRARKQAEAIAAAGGLQLGRVLSLNTEADYASRYGWDDFALRGVTVSTAGAVGDGSPTVVVQPSVPVSVTVYGRWELIPKEP